MPKPHNGGRNGKNANGRSQKNGTSRQNEKSTKTKAILKLRPARKPEQTIKASFNDRNDNEVKELIYTYDDGEPKENVVLVVTQLLQLAERYNLWRDEEWKILSQIGRRAFSGRAAEAWADNVENARAPRAIVTTVKALRAYYKKLVQEFARAYFKKNAAMDQKDAMESCKLTYEGHDHSGVVERLFRINEQLELLGTDI